MIFGRCKTTKAIQTIAVLIAEFHTDILRTIKEAQMSIEQDLADLRAEVAATRSAEAAATTAFNGVVQQLQAIQRQNSGNPTAYAAEIESFTASLAASRNDMAAAITANTPQEGQADPSAPAPNPSGNSAGGNVYGSTGPGDPNNQASNAPGSISNGSASTATPATASPTAGDPKAPAAAPSNTDTGATPPASGAPASATPSAGTSTASAPTSATTVGDPSPEQDKPAGSDLGMAAAEKQSTNFGSTGDNVASTKADKE